MSTLPGYLDAMLQTRYIKEVDPAVKHTIIDFYEVSFDMSSHNSFLKPVYEPHQRRRLGLKVYSHVRRWCQRSETPESETSLWIDEEEVLEEWAERCTQQNPGETSNSFCIRNHKGEDFTVPDMPYGTLSDPYLLVPCHTLNMQSPLSSSWCY